MPAESFNGLYKWELIYRQGPWRGLDDVEFATMTYIDWFNHRRLHGEITTDASYTTPAKAEDAYVMIGVDPHKRSHTATMLDRAERELSGIKVRAGRRQVAELLEWADGHEAADVGGGVGRWDGLSAVSAARRRR